MKRPHVRETNTTLTTLLVLVIVAILGFTGWYVWHAKTDADKTLKQATSSTPKTQASDPYAGWKMAKSDRAKFSIKYPLNWVFKEEVGNKDNIEHITISSDHFMISINSYPARGADDVVRGPKCEDCLSTSTATKSSLRGLGAIVLKNVRYGIDNGQGNALILTLPDDTYYIPSRVASDVTTTFRGISILDSESAYQSESLSQFNENPDFGNAKKILESVNY
jgi:hypothetical protein